MEDLAGKSVGVQTGTTGSMFVEDEIEAGVLTGLDTQVRHYNSAPIAMQDLIVGRLEAVIIDQHVALSIVAEHEGYHAIPFTFADGSAVGEQFGVAIQQGNPELLAVINEVITEMVEQDLIEYYIEHFTR
jgi:polar amino acid transport system substrate-binding protein